MQNKDNWNLVKTICKGCGKDIWAFPSRNKKYCSLECKKIGRTEKVKCLYCGKEFIAYKTEKHKFCCYEHAMKFRIGKKRDASIGRKTSATKLKRVLTKKSSGNKRAIYMYPKVEPCEICGVTKDKKRICRHHKDKNPLNNKRDNIQFLCTKCHMIIHELWKKRWKK